MATQESYDNIENILNEEYSEKPEYLNVADEGVKKYISKLFIMNTNSNYLTTKKNQLKQIIGKNRYKKYIIILLILLIIIFCLLISFILYVNSM